MARLSDEEVIQKTCEDERVGEALELAVREIFENGIDGVQLENLKTVLYKRIGSYAEMEIEPEGLDGEREAS